MANRILEGKLSVVTGGSRGIGAAICANLASKGSNIVINYTSTKSTSLAESLCEKLTKEYSVQVLCVQADLGSREGPGELIAKTVNHFHSRPVIDILINNAGVASKTPVGKYTADEFELIYRVNVLGPMMLVQLAERYLPNDRSGRVVNISSVSASLGLHEDAIYGGSKAALEACTRTWARELAERATVNAVNPGPVNTDMYNATSDEFRGKMATWNAITPLAAVRKRVDSQQIVDGAGTAGGRPAYDSEIAGVVGMLCSPDAGWCTGSVICANGGMRFST
ncbi:NAD(P)-binding protein [Piedraia hortae CBS 480.64]|uniref:NAD(P)-binding protein n=1 Tax=Piedraia hortae CBS 480.64 TaxID=1314780 RepID=A0A6A7C992_9PEZI|nr:NAD(P)-binding protein [Piedraia hortae CBS 480.64]